MPLPAPLLLPPHTTPAGDVALDMGVAENITYSVQASEDLVLWTTIGLILLWGHGGASGVSEFIDTHAHQFPYRYYRAVFP